MSTTRHLKLTLPGAFIGAWLVMLGLGIWHASHAAIPTIGYGAALLIIGGISMAFDTLGSYTRETRTLS